MSRIDKAVFQSQRGYYTVETESVRLYVYRSNRIIDPFVLAHAKVRFYHDAAHMSR